MEQTFIPYKADRHVESGTVLVLAPHPDDEVFGCGGAIIRHVAAGDPVHVVIVTDGGFQGKDGADDSDYSEIRRQESVAAAKVLGYGEPVFLGLPDRGLEYGEKLILQIQDEIGKYEPDFIYVSSIFEMHPDHRALGMSALEAVRRSEKPLRLAMYEVGVPLRPNLLLDISDISEQKLKAMDCFKSQLETQNYSEHISALNKFRTYTLPKTITAAEAYMVSSTEELSDDPFGIYSSEFDRQAKSGLKLDPGNAPLVTVIIRSMGRETYLREALDSVALQTYPNIEVLIVNAKGEGHPEMGEWCGRFPLRICGTGEPLARSRAANVGLDQVNGDYFAFLDEDDFFYPDHIASLIDLLQNHPDKIAAYAGVQCYEVDAGGGKVEKHIFNDVFDPVRLLCENFIPIHAMVLRREVIAKACRFDEALLLHEDWDFWLQCLQHGNFIHQDKITAAYHLGGNSTSGIWVSKSMQVRQSVVKLLEKWWPYFDAEKVQYNLELLRRKIAKIQNDLRKMHEQAAKYHQDLNELHVKAGQDHESLQKALDISQEYAKSLEVWKDNKFKWLINHKPGVDSSDQE